MDETQEALEFLKIEIEGKEKRKILSFEEYLQIARTDPQRVLRNIFQLFHDMVKTYVGEGENEHPDDPESIGFVKYDCSMLFAEGRETPFFADRLFANRFVRQAENLRRGSQQNRIYVYDGPHGCGKSTFLNNFLRKFEQYTATKEGQVFEIFWQIEIDGQRVDVPCPSHDYPILIIPKNYRAAFLKKILSESPKLRDKFLREKEYEWIFREEVCTICKSLFWALLDKLGSPDKVLSMVKVRSYVFDRRLGEGISIFNPGDKPLKKTYFTDKQIQEKLDQVFGGNLVKYIFSQHAKTNNGFYVLMDIKSYNKERLLELHNIISEGVHKVVGLEERINSLFMALMNPEDKQDIVGDVKENSFQGRIQYNKILYVLEPSTEVKIYRSIFGGQIDSRFLPRVMENFARIIISSRMNIDCPPLKEWIKDAKKYKKYCDENGLLLRMELYSGVIPPWLSEEDRKSFIATVRRKLISYGEEEGGRGFSGRDSIGLFSDFLSRYGSKPKLINMGNVTDFFEQRISKGQKSEVPSNFISSLNDWYDYVVLGEVKEALYFYNEKQVSEDILNYLCAINYDLGAKMKCRYTGKELEVTVEFFKLICSYVTGTDMGEAGALKFAQEIQQRYVEIVAQDPGQKITETELYQELFKSYVRNLKKKVLNPFLANKNFREAIKLFGTKEFETFDSRLKEHVAYLIKNLINKFGYTEQGAKEICLHVIDKKLTEKFS
ncbi:MAG: serine protein kinase PrkA [Candidatus Nealsonbacteria bacterium]|nr:serine protein kinase PrkA [Candidatus Nealsonbacteria bacterium]